MPIFRVCECEWDERFLNPRWRVVVDLEKRFADLCAAVDYGLDLQVANRAARKADRSVPLVEYGVHEEGKAFVRTVTSYDWAYF